MTSPNYRKASIQERIAIKDAVSALQQTDILAFADKYVFARAMTGDIRICIPMMAATRIANGHFTIEANIGPINQSGDTSLLDIIIEGDISEDHSVIFTGIEQNG